MSGRFRWWQQRAQWGALLFCALLGVMLPVREARADTYSQAMSQCQSAKAFYVSAGQWVVDDCFIEGPGSIVLNMSAGRHVFSYTGPSPPSNPCTVNAPSTSGGYNGRVLQDMTWCKAGVDTGKGDGSTVSCTMKFTVSGRPTQNQWGSWHTAGTLAASGDLCDGSGGAGSNNWKNADGTPAAAPVPPSPQATPPTVAPPKTCSGGSCYDPVSDKFCATSGGQQFCVSASAATGSDVAGNATPTKGGCASSGDSTICAGSPSAPAPPSPPQSPIADPPTSVTNVDQYTQANSKTGANVPVSVVTYTNPGGAPTTSGQQSGDVGPAPSSSTGSKPGNGASGGGDCGSPPAMTGDAALAMIARQQWLTRCGPDKTDKNGNGQPDWTEVGSSDGDQYNVPTTDASGVFQEKQVGTEQLDQSSWAGNTCPSLGSVEMWGTDFAPDSELLCQHLHTLRAIILLFAAITAAKILAMGNR